MDNTFTSDGDPSQITLNDCSKTQQNQAKASDTAFKRTQIKNIYKNVKSSAPLKYKNTYL